MVGTEHKDTRRELGWHNRWQEWIKVLPIAVLDEWFDQARIIVFGTPLFLLGKHPSLEEMSSFRGSSSFLVQAQKSKSGE